MVKTFTLNMIYIITTSFKDFGKRRNASVGEGKRSSHSATFESHSSFFIHKQLSFREFRTDLHLKIYVII